MKKNLLVARAVLEGSNAEASRILDEFSGPKMFPYLNHTTQSEISTWLGADPVAVRNAAVVRKMSMTKQMVKSPEDLKDTANRYGFRFKTVGHKTIRFFHSDLTDDRYIDIIFGAGNKTHMYCPSAVLSIAISLAEKNELGEMILEYVCEDEYYKRMISRYEEILKVEKAKKTESKNSTEENSRVMETIDHVEKNGSEANLEPLRAMPVEENSNDDLGEVLNSETVCEKVVNVKSGVITLTAEGLARIIKTVAEEVAASMVQEQKSVKVS